MAVSATLYGSLGGHLRENQGVSDQLIIAGFHRSGTSLTAQLLHRAGLFLGYELLEANPSNPYGHFEDRDVVDLHHQTLADNGLTWVVGEPFLPLVKQSRWHQMQQIIERRNAEHRLWGFKDPRACLFIMLWKYLLPNAKILFIYRHFTGPTRSLGRRHSTALFLNEANRHIHRRFWEEPDLALRMWLVHNNALLAFARAYPEDTLAVSLEMILDGFPIIWAINQRWNLGLQEVPVGEVFDPGITTGRSGKQPVSDRRLIDKVDATWQALEMLGTQTGSMLVQKEATVARK
jgi:Sulfotransferase family